MNVIKFSGRLTERDFRQIQLLAMRKVWVVIGIVLLVLLATNLAGGAWREFVANPRSAFMTWLPVVSLLPLAFAFQWFTIRRHWRSNQAIRQPSTVKSPTMVLAGMSKG
jgi:hypothetical protein